jgi:alcohol dehydrogenase
MGHQIGGRYDIPHGITSCIMLPHVLMFNSPVNSERQSWLATALGHPHGGLLPEEHANLLAFSIRDLIAELDLPSSLREYEADPATFAAVAQDVMRDPMVAGNPRPISDAQQIIDLLEAAW